MFKPVRIVATVVFLAMIGLVFVGAFVIKIDVRSSITHNAALSGMLICFFYSFDPFRLGSMYQYVSFSTPG
jgi:hypothetical protein